MQGMGTSTETSANNTTVGPDSQAAAPNSSAYDHNAPAIEIAYEGEDEFMILVEDVGDNKADSTPSLPAATGTSQGTGNAIGGTMASWSLGSSTFIGKSSFEEDSSFDSAMPLSSPVSFAETLFS